MIKHGKEIIVKSYYDGAVTSTKRQHEESLFTNSESLLKDVVEALGVIKRGDTKKLELEVCVDIKNRMRIVKRWSLKSDDV